MPSLADAFSGALSAFTPNVDVFQPIDPARFAEQAARETSPFYDKDLELAMKEIKLAREQAKQTREQMEQQQTENLTRFKGIQDKNFARALETTQSGFAGRGTFTSGFRRGNIGELQRGQDELIGGAELGAQQDTARRTLAFDQFGSRSALDEEQMRLQNERQRQEETINRQLQLAGFAQTQQSSAQDQFATQFSRFLGSRLNA